MRCLIVLACLAPVILAGGCFPDVDPGPEPSPRLTVSPDSLSFSTVDVGELTEPLTLTNIGTDTLTIEAFALEGSGAFHIDDAATELVLEPDESTELIVIYAPEAAGPVEGELLVTSNDRTGTAEVVQLGGDCLVPVIELDPMEHDFQDCEIGGCVPELQITIRNAGEAPLTIDSLEYTPTSDELESSFDFSEGTVLAPGATETVNVHYEPLDELPDTSYLHVYSNDPFTPDALATQTGTGTLAAQVEDTFEVDLVEELDILWVIDNSAAMAPFQDSLATSFASFLDILAVLDVDYHLAVITVDDHSFVGPTPIITPATVDPIGAFATAAAVGTSGTGTNEGLNLGLEALLPPLTDPGGPHDGYLRGDAGLRVIYLSATDDQSAGSVADLATSYQLLKANPDHVVLSAIVDLAVAQRYQDAAQMTGGLIDDINNAQWVNTLSNLAWHCMCIHDLFELSQEPVDWTIEVLVNEVPVAQGWEYDPIYNAVVFEEDHLPDDGDEVLVRYNMLAACE